VKGLYRNIGLASITGVSKAVLSFATVVVVARALGPQGRGDFAFVTNFAGVLSLVFSAGATASLVAARRQRDWHERLLIHGAWTIVVLSAVPMLLLAVIWHWTAGMTVNSLVAVTSVPVLVATMMLSQVAQIESHYPKVLLSVLMSSGVAVLAMTVVWLTTGLTLGNALLVWFFTSAVGVATLITRAEDREPRQASLDLAHQKVERQWFVRQSISANIPTIATLLIWRLDLLMIEWFQGGVAVGHYSIAVGIAEAIMIVSIGLRTGLVAHLADLDRDVLFDTVGPIFRAASAAMSLMAIVIVVVSPFIVQVVFGTEFEPAISSMRILVLGIPFLVLQYPLVDVLIAVGKSATLARSTLLFVIANAIANAIVLSVGDIWMVALTATLTYLILFLWVFVLVRREFALTLRQLLWPYSSEWVLMLTLVSGRRVQP
jgi:O-antigen/teichoic acid export membrane protein